VLFRSLASHAKHGFGLDLVRRRDSGEAIGLCGLIQRDSLDAPDLGYAFLQAHHGQGFATEAAAAVLRHARDVLGLRRLHAITSPDNHGSVRVLEKNGFREQAALTMPDQSTPSRLFLLES
jgi:RimJ/RimL family protein N-acetyltransferase